MPLFARWRSLGSLDAIRGRDARPGVYELADEQRRIIYIGQSVKDVPNRIRQHLRRNPCIAAHAVYWRFEASRVPEAAEAQTIDDYLKCHGSLPPCNQVTPRLRDQLRRYQERSRTKSIL